MSRDCWMTPPNVIELVRQAMGSIDYDPASNHVAQEYVKATHYCIHPNEPVAKTPFCHVNGLAQNWDGNVFCNPPYSRGNIDKFVGKFFDQWMSDAYIENPSKQAIFLVNSQTDTAWYHDLLEMHPIVLLWRGRMKFWKIFDGKAHEKWEGELSKEKGLGKVGNSPRFLNTLMYFGERKERFIRVFKDKGTFLHVD